MTKLLFAFVVLIVSITTARAQTDDTAADKPLPKLSEMELPTVEQLLQGKPHDWIVLKTDEVIVSEPVVPRPDTLAKMEAAIQESQNWPAPKSRAELDEQQERKRLLRYLTVVIPNSEEPEYLLEMRHVKQILHHEDLMLRRVDRLIEEGQLATAYEVLSAVDRRRRGWPGYEDRRQRLLLTEAELRFQTGDAESALVYLEDLHERNKSYAGLQDMLGRVVGALMEAAVEQGDYRRARHFLARLTNREPRHPTAVKWQADLLQRAEHRLQAARAAEQQEKFSEAVALTEEAARIWPRTPSLRAIHRQINRRYPTLRVGVPHFAGEPFPIPRSIAADERERRLVDLALFNVDRVDRNGAHYTTRYFEEWTPTDLGRQLEFHLRPERAAWEALPQVTAPKLAAGLAGRLDPRNPRYDERLAGFVEAITVQSPFEMTVQLARAPLRAEALFRLELDDDVDPQSASPFQRFKLQERTEQHSVYARNRVEPAGLSQYHVAEVIETRYENADRALQGLLRGEVSFLPRVRLRDVPLLQADARFLVQKYALPESHVLQFHPQSQPLKNAELRRALADAIDRPTILRETLLANADRSWGRLTTAPYPIESNGYDSLLPQRTFDLPLAISLALTARKALGGTLPMLRMVCEPDPAVESAATQLVAHWKRAGIDVQIVSPTEAGQDWDIIYRTARIAEPATELVSFLALHPQPRIEHLAYLPDWLRQEVSLLESTSEWSTATRQLRRLQTQLLNDVQYVPLWELDQFQALRKTIGGVPAQPMHPYHEIERWTVEPWYPTDTP